MKLSWLTLAVLLALLAVVVATWFVGAPPENAPAAGTTHPIIDNMLIGGPGEAKHAKVFALGVAFGVLEIVFFSVCLALGASRRGRVGKLALPIGIGAALHVGTFLAMIVSYRSYLDGNHQLFLGLPAPTAWMMYGMWWMPMYFILLYIIAFDRYVFSEDDLKRFNAILDKRDRREGIDA